MFSNCDEKPIGGRFRSLHVSPRPTLLGHSGHMPEQS